jgi:hypothetical protein
MLGTIQKLKSGGGKKSSSLLHLCSLKLKVE